MYRILIVLAALIAITALISSSNNYSLAQEGAASKDAEETKDLSLEQVLENYYKAIGGLENWRNINSLRMLGDMVSMDKSIPVRATYMRPNKCRVEFKVKNAVIVQAYDGTMGWQHNPNGKVIVPKPLSKGRSNYLNDTCVIGGPLNDYMEKGAKLKLLGTEDLYGKKTYKILVTHKTGNVQTYYLDAKTFLPVRLDGVYQMDGTEHKVTTSYFDYKKTGKVVMPYKFDFDITGSPGTEQMTFKRVEVNPVVKESYFNKPN